MTQYQAILDHLRKHKVATVRDLLRFTNYPSARIHEMTDPAGFVWNAYGGMMQQIGAGTYRYERITRTWVQRNGKKVRLYCLTKA